MVTRTAALEEAAGVDVSSDVMREQAYLIARGVRAIAIVGHCVADPLIMRKTSTALESVSAPGSIPFVIDAGHGVADYGFAASPWVLELYRWAVTTNVPEKQRARIVGLLLGYGVQAIRAFEDETSGRLFQPSSASDEREST